MLRSRKPHHSVDTVRNITSHPAIPHPRSCHRRSNQQDATSTTTSDNALHTRPDHTYTRTDQRATLRRRCIAPAFPIHLPPLASRLLDELGVKVRCAATTRLAPAPLSRAQRSLGVCRSTCAKGAGWNRMQAPAVALARGPQLLDVSVRRGGLARVGVPARDGSGSGQPSGRAARQRAIAHGGFELGAAHTRR